MCWPGNLNHLSWLLRLLSDILFSPLLLPAENFELHHQRSVEFLLNPFSLSSLPPYPSSTHPLQSSSSLSFLYAPSCFNPLPSSLPPSPPLATPPNSPWNLYLLLDWSSWHLLVFCWSCSNSFYGTRQQHGGTSHFSPSCHRKSTTRGSRTFLLIREIGVEAISFSGGRLSICLLSIHPRHLSSRNLQTCWTRWCLSESCRCVFADSCEFHDKRTRLPCLTMQNISGLRPKEMLRALRSKVSSHDQTSLSRLWVETTTCCWCSSHEIAVDHHQYTSSFICWNCQLSVAGTAGKVNEWGWMFSLLTTTS